MGPEMWELCTAQEDGSDASIAEFKPISSIRELLKLKEQPLNPAFTSVFFTLYANTEALANSVSCSDSICQLLTDFTVHADRYLNHSPNCITQVVVITYENM